MYTEYVNKPTSMKTKSYYIHASTNYASSCTVVSDCTEVSATVYSLYMKPHNYTLLYIICYECECECTLPGLRS